MKILMSIVALLMMFVWFMVEIGTIYGLIYLHRVVQLSFIPMMSLVFLDVVQLVFSFILCSKLTDYLEMKYHI